MKRLQVEEDSQRRGQKIIDLDDIQPLYHVIEDAVPADLLRKKNASKSWRYGYNSKYDMVVISKDGTIGDVYEISGLRIALPAYQDKHLSRSDKAKDQYWERRPLPADLKRIKHVYKWNEKPMAFRQKWAGYIDQEFDRRENGLFFMNNGTPTYVTGKHYFYLQWSKIDGQYPGFREANRIFWIYWEACIADDRSYGMIYLKIRRSGFSYMASSDTIETATLSSHSELGMLSKTGPDAKKMFTGKVVNMNTNLPFFFKPIQDGMDKPKTELLYQVPSKRISRKNMIQEDEIDEEEGLNTVISWLSTDSNSYDGYKLIRLIHDESGKWQKPADLTENWDVTKTCLRLGSKIVGKCMMGSTCNAQNKGGAEFQSMYEDSDPSERNDNGQTVSGLYRLFIPMEWNYEGHIDRYGMPVFYDPAPGERIYDDKGERITRGAIPVWQAEVDALKHKPKKQNEYYRQYPRTKEHAFRDDATESVFDLTKLYDQIDYNNSIIIHRRLQRGNFKWKNGKRGSEVIWSPDPRGRFLLGWMPPVHMRNAFAERNGLYYPLNERFGAFGCDSYDISGVVGGGGSKGALHGQTKAGTGQVPDEEFFLEYIARPSTAEIFYEDVLMAICFYGMPMLAENNKPRLLYHLKNNGFRKFSMNRPDKPFKDLSKTEKELGGIPSAGIDNINNHAAAIESFIDRKVGYDHDGVYRPIGKIGSMPFNRTLKDWASFDISNRTRFDASISSGLAIMANSKHIYKPQRKKSKITLNFAS